MASAECSEEDCDRLVFEAVNESSVFKFQFVKHTYHQVQVLTSLVQCNEKGETPLVIAMKGENFSLIDQLVNFLRQCDREDAKCHEMSMIVIDQLIRHQIPVMELIEHLIKQPYYNILVYSEWLDFVAQVVFKSTSLSRQEKIIALELIGASQCNYRHYYEGNPFAVTFRCWREAMTLRYFPADGEPLLPKIPYVGVPSELSSVVFDSAVEVMTMEELNLLQEHFELNVVDIDLEVQLRCIDLLKRQSLLVIRRISSQANHGHPHWFYLQSLYEFGRDQMEELINIVDSDEDSDEDIDGDNDEDGDEDNNGDGDEDNDGDGDEDNDGDGDEDNNGDGDEDNDGDGDEDNDGDGDEDIVGYSRIAVNTFLLILEQMAGIDPKTLSRKLFDVFIETLGAMFHGFYLMARESPSPHTAELSYANLLAATKFISTIAKFFPTPAMISTISDSYYSFAEIISHLASVLEYIYPRLHNQEKQKLEEYLSNYIRNYFLERTTTALHSAVDRGMTKNLGLIKLILRVGADPNVMDEDGQTPLHILAEKEEVYSDECLPIFQALVDAGAHLDMAADNGDTVLDILKRKLKMYKDRGVIAESYFSSLITTVFPLSCYCARVIRQSGIDEDRLPLKLQKFVSRHSAKGSVDLRQRRDN